MWIIEKIGIAILTAVLLFIFAFLAQGPLVAALGGVTKADLAAAVDNRIRAGGLLNRAVVAFDATTCPEGWSEFTNGRGKFVLGTSDVYSTGVSGGAETATLDRRHLPKHSHAFKDTYFAEARNRVPPNAMDTEIPDRRGLKGEYDHDNVGWAKQSTTAIAGEDIPFSIMPPYIVLTLCQPK